MTEFKENDWNELGDGKTNVFLQEPEPAEHKLRIIIQKKISSDENGNFSQEEIFNLLSDGLKFRIIAQAEKIKQDMVL